jgi:hypothetical protein
VAKAFRKFGIDVNTADWSPTVEFRNQVLLACQELAALIPFGSKFIFIEWGHWGPGKIVPGCQAIPFMERDGQYWGTPPNDPTAIEELERLRQADARFVVFGWSAFWWLEYYSDFHKHLRSWYRRILKNERLVVFDLRFTSGIDDGS